MVSTFSHVYFFFWEFSSDSQSFWGVGRDFFFLFFVTLCFLSYSLRILILLWMYMYIYSFQLCGLALLYRSSLPPLKVTTYQNPSNSNRQGKPLFELLARCPRDSQNNLGCWDCPWLIPTNWRLLKSPHSSDTGFGGIELNWHGRIVPEGSFSSMRRYKLPKEKRNQ